MFPAVYKAVCVWGMGLAGPRDEARTLLRKRPPQPYTPSFKQLLPSPLFFSPGLLRALPSMLRTPKAEAGTSPAWAAHPPAPMS